VARSKSVRAKAKPKRRGGGVGRFLGLAIGWGLILGVLVPVVLVAIYRFVPPPGTILMVQRSMEGKGWNYSWRPIERISPALVQAAIASEDARFCEHRGFDFEAIEKAMEHNKRHPKRIRGASTISQQTAKNVFLWPSRDWVRKGLETYFTGLIEIGWGKRRIMEIYLNVAEMGPGVYGAQAAAKKYFKTDASKLTSAQAARLVAVLPNPLKYKAATPGKYVQRRSRRIGGAMGTVRQAGLADCVLD
jgi:monofunctional glycosyltransferase